jgi:hypothetical protein
VHVWTFRAGKAVRFTEYFDTATLNAALDPATPSAGTGTRRPVGASS